MVSNNDHVKCTCTVNVSIIPVETNNFFLHALLFVLILVLQLFLFCTLLFSILFRIVVTYLHVSLPLPLDY